MVPTGTDIQGIAIAALGGAAVGVDRQRAYRDVTERQLTDRPTPRHSTGDHPGRGRCPVGGYRLHELRHPPILHRTTDSRRAADGSLARALLMSVDDPWS